MWTGQEKSIIATAALTEMNPEYKLDFWQDWYLKSNHRFLIVNKSRRIGWSYITSLKSVVEANCPSVTKYQNVFVSYGMQDAIGKISDARNALMNLPEQWRKDISSDSKTALEFWDVGRKSKSQLISLPNRTLRGFGTANPFGGISLDEFAFHQDDDKVYESALPCLTRGGLLSIGSTPLAKNGQFYDILSDKERYKSYERVNIPWWWSSALCMDVKTALDEAGDLSTHERVERFGTDILKEIYSSMALPSFKQEFECEFTDESEAFITLEMIMSCTPQQVEQYEYQSIAELLNGVNIPEICTGFHEGQPIFESVTAPAYHPDIHGSLYGGWDMGRTKDSSIFTLIGYKDNQYRVWMSYELKNTRFDEQKKFAELAMESLPIRSFLIDRNGLGMDFAEWAETRWPTRANGVAFTNESKEDMANKVYLGFERRSYVLPMNRKLHADIHCIRKTLTAMKFNKYDGRTKDSHADRFWSLALATIGIEDTDKNVSQFYKGYKKSIEKQEERQKIVKTGNAELDRIKRQILRSGRRGR
jgi:phage FluMu gp28-like protein